jgi:hypothetical protein
MTHVAMALLLIYQIARSASEDQPDNALAGALKLSPAGGEP